MKIKAGEASVAFWPQEFNSWNHSIANNLSQLGANSNNIFPGESFFLFPAERFPSTGLQFDWQTYALGQSTIGLSFDSCYCDFEICFGETAGPAIAVEFVLNGQLISRSYSASPAPQAGDPVVPAVVADAGNRWFASTSRVFAFTAAGRNWTWTETGEDWYEVRIVQIASNGTKTQLGSTIRLPVVSLTTAAPSGFDTALPSCPISATLAISRQASGWALNLLASNSLHAIHLIEPTTAALQPESRWFCRVLQPANGTPTTVSYQGTIYGLTRLGGGSRVLIDGLGVPVMQVQAQRFLAVAQDGTTRLLTGGNTAAADAACAYSGWPLDRVGIASTGNARVVRGGMISAAGGDRSTVGPGFMDGPFSCARGFAFDHLNFSTQFTTQFETVPRWTAKAVAYPLPRPAAMPPNNTDTSPGSPSNRGETRFLSEVGGTPLSMTLSQAPETVYQMRIDATRRQAPPESSWFHQAGEREYAILGHDSQFVSGEPWTYRGPVGPYGVSQFWESGGDGAIPKQFYAGFSHVMAEAYEHCPALIINGVPEKTPAITWAEDVQLQDSRNGYRLPLNWFWANGEAGPQYFNFRTSIETDERQDFIGGVSIVRNDYYVPDESNEIDISQSNYTVTFSSQTIGLLSQSAVTVSLPIFPGEPFRRQISAPGITFDLDYS